MAMDYEMERGSKNGILQVDNSTRERGERCIA